MLLHSPHGEGRLSWFIFQCFLLLSSAFRSLGGYKQVPEILPGGAHPFLYSNRRRCSSAIYLPSQLVDVSCQCDLITAKGAVMEKLRSKVRQRNALNGPMVWRVLRKTLSGFSSSKLLQQEHSLSGCLCSPARTVG